MKKNNEDLEQECLNFLGQLSLTYLGCFEDYEDRTLPELAGASGDNDHQWCAQRCCEGWSHPFSGTQVRRPFAAKIWQIKYSAITLSSTPIYGGLVVHRLRRESKTVLFCCLFLFQYHEECWCGASAPDSSNLRGDGDCNTDCRGDSGQMCGGGWRNTVHQVVDAGTRQKSSVIFILNIRLRFF